MKWKLYVAAGCLIPMSLCGCIATMISEKAASVAAPPEIEHFSFDLSTTGVDSGTLAVHCASHPTRLQ